MALTAPQDTLAYHQSRLLTAARDMSHVPCSSVAKQMREKSPHGLAVPEKEAMRFYASNHVMSLITASRHPLEPLEGWELKTVEKYYGAQAQEAVVRAFYYLIIICTRESRHNKSAGKVAGKWGQPLGDFFTKINGGEMEIWKKFRDNPPDATIGQYVDCMRWQFNTGGLWGSSFGGKAWGKVCDCLCRFVRGEFTAEMMMDTIWTLAHNNGPIFNKGQLYGSYGQSIYRLLDVQRSGQIPEAIIHNDAYLSHYVDQEVRDLVFEAHDVHFPNAFGKYLDWEKVEALGSVHKYPKEIAVQQSTHGKSPAAAAAEAKAAKDAEMKSIAIAAQKAKEKEEAEKEMFTVMPGVTVAKVHRKEAA